MLKKYKLRGVLISLLILYFLCSCFLTFGRTSAYITDLSNTCVNTFSAETVEDEQPTDTVDEQTTEQTTHEKADGSTVNVDKSPISPETGDYYRPAAVAFSCGAVICAGLLLKRKSKEKKRKD